MNTRATIKILSVEEYLSMEDASLEKHEYYNGRMFTRDSADFPHVQITSNAIGQVGQFLKNKYCRIYGSDLKVNVRTQSAFVYPDLSIVCKGPQFLEARKNIITNPSVIIEIFSQATQNFDHGEKFMLYRQIDTLKEYILISSMEVLVERFVRHEAGSWILTEYKNLEDEIIIDTISYTTKLAELYRDVVFDEMIDTLN